MTEPEHRITRVIYARVPNRVGHVVDVLAKRAGVSVSQFIEYLIHREAARISKECEPLDGTKV